MNKCEFSTDCINEAITSVELKESVPVCAKCLEAHAAIFLGNVAVSSNRVTKEEYKEVLQLRDTQHIRDGMIALIARAGNKTEEKSRGMVEVLAKLYLTNDVLRKSIDKFFNGNS